MSYYKMIAREDFEAMLRDAGKELEARRTRYYSALEVLPQNDFESRDALNSEISSANGEQRALRRCWDWVNENYPRESARPVFPPNFTEGPSPLNGRSREEEAKDFGVPEQAWRDPGKIMGSR